jgi:hypothetical protein
MTDSPSNQPAPLAPSAVQRVVELLGRAYAADHLTQADLEARLDRAYRVTTLAQLDALVADLDVAEAPEAEALTPTAAADTLPDMPGRRITAVLSGREQRLVGVMPRRLHIRARLGYVELDLSDATFAPGVTEIDVRALAGYVQLRLPPGVHVESDGQGLFGFFAERGRAVAASAGAPVVHITGRAVFGFAEYWHGSQA